MADTMGTRPHLHVERRRAERTRPVTGTVGHVGSDAAAPRIVEWVDRPAAAMPARRRLLLGAAGLAAVTGLALVVARLPDLARADEPESSRSSRVEPVVLSLPPAREVDVRLGPIQQSVPLPAAPPSSMSSSMSSTGSASVSGTPAELVTAVGGADAGAAGTTPGDAGAAAAAPTAATVTAAPSPAAPATAPPAPAANSPAAAAATPPPSPAPISVANAEPPAPGRQERDGGDDRGGQGRNAGADNQANGGNHKEKADKDKAEKDKADKEGRGGAKN